MKPRIYLDNNASTSVDPLVIEAIIQNLHHSTGNPSSLHSFGREARQWLNQARQIVADFLHIKPNEIIFNSGGTEGINMVIRGLLYDHKQTGHVVTSDQEHSSVYRTIKNLEENGCQTTFISPGLWGAVTPEAVQAALQPNTRLIAVMAANNETGVKTDIDGIAAVAQEARIPFLVDGVALMGKELFNIPAGVSAMCFSGHKFHAPKGVGFAFVRSNLKLSPYIIGGEQEYGRRGGAENLSGIVGLGEAVRLLKSHLPEATRQMESLRNRLEEGIKERVPDVYVNGQGPRIANTTNLSFAGVEGESLLAALDMESIAVSHGSACSSGALEPSRILVKMGIPLSLARSSIRFSLSRFTTAEEIETCIDIVEGVVLRLRK